MDPGYFQGLYRSTFSAGRVDLHSARDLGPVFGLIVISSFRYFITAHQYRKHTGTMHSSTRMSFAKVCVRVLTESCCIVPEKSMKHLAFDLALSPSDACSLISCVSPRWNMSFKARCLLSGVEIRRGPSTAAQLTNPASAGQ